MDRSIGLNPKDIRYLNVDSKARGFGPNRLKSLEMEGRWVLSPHSIPFIRAAFEQVEKLNGPGRMEELMGPSMNAIGLNSWTSDNRINDQDSYVQPGHEYIRRAVVVKKPQYPRSHSVQIRRDPMSPSIDRRSAPSPLPLPPLPPIQTTSPIPSELPHRTAGPAHQYKRPSPNDQSNYLPPLMWSRSRSSSVSPRSVAVNQTAGTQPSYVEFEAELLAFDKSRQLRHVKSDEPRRLEVDAAPLKSELLSFDRTRLRNPLYSTTWTTNLQPERSTVIDESLPFASRLSCIGHPATKSEMNEQTIGSEVDLVGSGGSSATITATIVQRAMKRSSAKMHIAIDETSEESEIEDDTTTLEVNETPVEERLTTHFRDVAELEDGILALQKDLGLVDIPFSSSTTGQLNSNKENTRPVTTTTHSSSLPKAIKTQSTMLSQKLKPTVIKDVDEGRIVEKKMRVRRPRARWSMIETPIRHKRLQTRWLPLRRQKREVPNITSDIEQIKLMTSAQNIDDIEEENKVEEAVDLSSLPSPNAVGLKPIGNKTRRSRRSLFIVNSELMIEAIESSTTPLTVKLKPQKQYVEDNRGPSIDVQHRAEVQQVSKVFPQSCIWITKPTVNTENHSVDNQIEVSSSDNDQLIASMTSQQSKLQNVQSSRSTAISNQPNGQTNADHTPGSCLMDIKNIEGILQPDNLAIHRSNEMTANAVRNKLHEAIRASLRHQEANNETSRRLLEPTALDSMIENVSKIQFHSAKTAQTPMKIDVARLMEMAAQIEAQTEDQAPISAVERSRQIEAIQSMDFNQVEKGRKSTRLLQEPEEAPQRKHSDGSTIGGFVRRLLTQKKKRTTKKKIKAPVHTDAYNELSSRHNSDVLTRRKSSATTTMITSRTSTPPLKPSHDNENGRLEVEILKRLLSQKAQQNDLHTQLKQTAYEVANELQMNPNDVAQLLTAGTEQERPLTDFREEHQLASRREEVLEDKANDEHLKNNQTTATKLSNEFVRRLLDKRLQQKPTDLFYVVPDHMRIQLPSQNASLSSRDSSLQSVDMSATTAEKYARVDDFVQSAQQPPPYNLKRFVHAPLPHSIHSNRTHSTISVDSPLQSRRSTLQPNNSKSIRRGLSTRLRHGLQDAIFHMNGIPLTQPSVRASNRLHSVRQMNRNSSRTTTAALRDSMPVDESVYARVELADDDTWTQMERRSFLVAPDRPNLPPSRRPSILQLTPRCPTTDANKENVVVDLKKLQEIKSPSQIADDLGYYSNYSSVQSSPRRNDAHYRPPHRTPVLSDSRPCIASYDNDYDDGILRRANSMASLGRHNPNYRSGRRIRFDIPDETSKWTSRYSSTDSLNHSPGSTWSLRRYGSRDNFDLPSTWQFNRQGSRRYLGGRSPIQNFR